MSSAPYNSDAVSQEILTKVKEKRGELLTGFSNAFKPVRIRCERGHEFELKIGELNKGNWCPLCSDTPEILSIAKYLQTMNVPFMRRYQLPESKITYDFGISMEGIDPILIKYDTKEAMSNKLQIKAEISLAEKKQHRLIRINYKCTNINKFLDEVLTSDGKLELCDKELYKGVVNTGDAATNNTEKPIDHSPQIKDKEDIKVPLEYDSKTPNDRVVLGYIRVSTKEQSEGYSPANQRERIRRWAAMNGKVVKKYYEDSGISGAGMENRPALRELLNDIRAQMTLLVPNIDRLTRNVEDGQKIVNEMKEKHAILKSIEQDIDIYTPDGMSNYTILTNQSQRERAVTGTRTSSVMNYLSSIGKLETKPRFGIKVVGTGKNKKRVECKEEQDAMTEIRRIRADLPWCTPTLIANEMNKKGYSCRKAKKWTGNRTATILSQMGLQPYPDIRDPTKVKQLSEQKQNGLNIKRWTLEVIMTFRSGEQKFGAFGINKRSITENELLYAAFSTLSDKEVEELIKVSFCQTNTDADKDLIPALRLGGEFYFNTNVNRDENTKRYANIKHEYLKNRNAYKF